MNWLRPLFMVPDIAKNHWCQQDHCKHQSCLKCPTNCESIPRHTNSEFSQVHTWDFTKGQVSLTISDELTLYSCITNQSIIATKRTLLVWPFSVSKYLHSKHHSEAERAWLTRCADVTPLQRTHSTLLLALFRNGHHASHFYETATLFFSLVIFNSRCPDITVEPPLV